MSSDNKEKEIQDIGLHYCAILNLDSKFLHNAQNKQAQENSNEQGSINSK